MTAAQVVHALQTNLSALGLAEDEEQAHLFAILRFVEQSLPKDLQPLLLPLALHEGFVDANMVEAMSKQVDAQWTRARIDTLFQALTAAGLLQDHGQAVYEMHPVLTGFLRLTILKAASSELRDTWTRPFVDVMGRVADRLAPRPLHEQRAGFYWHGANFHHALGEAERLEMDAHFAALTQALAFYAQNTRSYKAAADLFARLAEHASTRGDHKLEASAYHQLGIIAQEQRDFAATQSWYLKSLAI
jgi:tetratricopeptide (TPR) repeat protein